MTVTVTSRTRQWRTDSRGPARREPRASAARREPTAELSRHEWSNVEDARSERKSHAKASTHIHNADTHSGPASTLQTPETVRARACVAHLATHTAHPIRLVYNTETRTDVELAAEDLERVLPHHTTSRAFFVSWSASTSGLPAVGCSIARSK